MLKQTALALAALTLSACATRPEWLENHIACTPDGEELHALSVWGPFSIGSRIVDDEAAIVCEKLRKP